MNVWAWVQELADELSRSGQADVAAKLHRLPELALKGDHDRHKSNLDSRIGRC